MLFRSMEVLSSESFDTCWARLVKGDTVQRTMRLRSPSGISHDLDAVFLPEFGADGQLLRVLFSARDVTDLTRWRADADRSKRLLDTLLAISESAFVILDAQRNIFSASEQLGRYLNCDVAGLIGKPWSEFLEPGSSEPDFHFLHSAELGSDRPFSIRLRPAEIGRAHV